MTQKARDFIKWVIHLMACDQTRLAETYVDGVLNGGDPKKLPPLHCEVEE